MLKKLQSNNVSELLDKVKSGDKTAFSVLYDMYSKALYGIILKIVNDEEVADDVLQDSFIKIWNKVASYDEKKGTAFTWMLNISRNTAIDFLRLKQNKVIMHSIDQSYSEIKNIEDSSILPDTIDVKKNLQLLKPEHQEIIELVYFRGYRQEEIVRQTNMPLGTVKTRVRLALIALRQIYGQAG